MKFIELGRIIERGTLCYQKNDFNQAVSYFNRAVEIDPNDFSANFWLMRSYIRQGKLSSAKHYLLKCHMLKPEMKELLERWSQRMEQTFDNNDDINPYTENILKQSYFAIKLSLDVVLISFLVFIVVTWLAVHFIGYPPLIVLTFTLICLLQYLNSKTLLPLNLWLRIKMIIEDSKKLLSSSTFIIQALILLAFSLMWSSGIYILLHWPNVKVAYITMYQSWLESIPITYLLIALLTPIGEELLFRSVLYSYLKKYCNQASSFFIVAILFVFIHPQGRGPLTLFLNSLVFTWFYYKYKTVLAPIFIHILYNLLTFMIIAFILKVL